jgi:trigger factor
LIKRVSVHSAQSIYTRAIEKAETTEEAPAKDAPAKKAPAKKAAAKKAAEAADE